MKAIHTLGAHYQGRGWFGLPLRDYIVYALEGNTAIPVPLAPKSLAVFVKGEID